jgi:hypothetical protein
MGEGRTNPFPFPSFLFYVLASQLQQELMATLREDRETHAASLQRAARDLAHKVRFDLLLHVMLVY